MTLILRLWFVGVLFAALPEFACARSDFPPKQLLDRITPNGIRVHMAFLADDLLEGRGTVRAATSSLRITSAHNSSK
jgi:hypothetical protein